jgi:hypothetical protein
MLPCVMRLVVGGWLSCGLPVSLTPCARVGARV